MVKAVWIVAVTLVIAGLCGAIGWVVYRNFLNPEPVFVPLRNQNQTSNPDSIFPYYYEPLPGSLYETLEIKTLINSDSLNEPREYTKPKPEGVFRIVLVGDSTTFGYGVAQEETFGERMEVRMNEAKSGCTAQIEIINTGVPGHDAAYEVERLRLRGIAYQPDLLVWMLSDDDISNNLERRRAIVAQLRNSGMDFAAADTESLKQVGKEVSIQEAMKRSMEQFERVPSFYTGEIFFIAISQISLEFLHDLQTLFPQATVMIEPVSFQERHIALRDGHPNPSGHELLATRIGKTLVENKLVPCEQY